jgi:hypothetical protein
MSDFKFSEEKIVIIKEFFEKLTERIIKICLKVKSLLAEVVVLQYRFLT